MSTTFNLNKLNIITRAYQMINVRDLNSSPTSAEISYASDILNLMLKSWEAQGINLWKRRLGTLFPALATRSYSLGSAGDHATLSYVSTALSSAAASSATTLNLDSSSGMTIGDYIGIELDDGTRQWTTIATIPTSTSVTINSALTDTAATDNTVISYTTKITRPLTVIRATVLDLSNNTEATMQLISHNDYFNYPSKTTAGRPNNFYYDKLLSGSSPYTGTLYLYPVPNDVNHLIVFSFQESLSDILNATDYPDVPQEWGLALITNLAYELACAFDNQEKIAALQQKAVKELMMVQTFDSDDAPLKIKMKFPRR